MNKTQTPVASIPEAIIVYLEAQTCASICCMGDDVPWCFSCFYAFDPDNNMIYYKSSTDTKHSSLIMENGRVSGTVLPDRQRKISIQGVQFQGTVLVMNDAATASASAYYHKVHPLALAIPGEVWALQLDYIKMTDSTLGFGKKMIWKPVY